MRAARLIVSACGLFLAVGARLAEAQPVVAREAASPAAEAARSRRFAIEALVGKDTPLGGTALATSYAFTDRLALGGGIGVDGLAVPAGVRANVHYAAFARLRLWRAGRLALGAVVTASLADRDHAATYRRPGYAPDDLHWTWRPAYRADGGLAAEVAAGVWALRLEGGVGYVLNRPSCDYSNGLVYVSGSCDDSIIPTYYHFSRPPGQIAPYLALGVSRALEEEPAPGGGGAASKTAPASAGGGGARIGAAWAAPTALTPSAGSVVATVYELMLVDVGYAVTDRLRVDAGGGYFFPDRGPALATASVRARLLDAGHFHLGALAGAFGVIGHSTFSAVLAGAGPVASVCIDRDCASVVSASVLGGGAFEKRAEVSGEGGTDHGTGVLVSPSAVLALHRNLALVGEGHFVPGTDGIIWLAALRVPYGAAAADAGVLHLPEIGAPRYAPIGSVSWRW